MRKRAIFAALMLAVSTVAGPVCAVEADSMFTQDAAYEQTVQTANETWESPAMDGDLEANDPAADLMLRNEIPAAEEVFQGPELPEGQEPGQGEAVSPEESEQPEKSDVQEPTGEEGSEELGSLEDLPTAGNDVEELSKGEEENDEFQDGLEAEGKELEASIVQDGVCGGDLTWSLDSLGTLRIQGVGAMDNYWSPDVTPWAAYRNSVTKIIVEEGVTTIGDHAFSYGRQTSVSLPSTLEIIGQNAFSLCEQMTSITIPSSVISIGNMAFYWCSELSSVTIPGDIDLLFAGDEIFYHCTALTNVVIPVGMKTIPAAAFQRCYSLTSVTVESGITSIGYGAFAESGISSIVIPSTVESIGNSVFEGCKSLAQATLQKGLKTIGEKAFYECVSLTEIAIPEGVTTLGGYTFYHCTSLKKVSLPNTLTNFTGMSVFYDCTSLAEINLPSSLTQLGFEPFVNCSSLTSITIPEKVTVISSSAFFNCTSLREVSIPQGVIDIGHQTFQGCRSLNGITFPDSLRSVGNDAFRDCTSLTSVTFPASFIDFNSDSFRGCTSLRSIYFEGDGPNILGNTFKDVVARVYYPAGNDTWTEKIGQNYGGTLIWEAYTPVLRVPTLISAINVNGGVQVRWGKVSAASGYYVYRKAGTGSWTLLGRTTGTTYVDKKGTPGTTYTYTIRAYRGDYAIAYANRYKSDYWSDMDSKGIGARLLSAPVVSSATNTATGISLKWTRAAGASGYYIYRRNVGGSYVKIATIRSGSTVSYGDTKVANGGVYQYAIRAYYGTSVSTYQVKTIARLSRNAISSALNNAAGRVTVKWSRNAKATGYQVYYKTGSASKIVTVKGNTVLTKAITGLKKGSTYTIMVRSYRTVSGANYYSAWSPAKTVKITK